MAKRINKTQATDASVDDYLASIASDEQRKDCQAVLQLLRKITKLEPKMWGPSIVGFGSYHYKYDSGHEGDCCLTGFAARKGTTVVYLICAGAEQTPLLEKLGKFKMGKSCLHFKRLSDIDIKILEKLVKASLAEVKRRYG